MRFTKWIVSGFEDDTIIHAFYDRDVFCSSYHAHDIPVEWEQLAFLLSKCSSYENFEYIDWSCGKQVEIIGLSHDQVVDIDCKLCQYQFSKRIRLERQLEVVKDDSTNQ